MLRVVLVSLAAIAAVLAGALGIFLLRWWPFWAAGILGYVFGSWMANFMLGLGIGIREFAQIGVDRETLRLLIVGSYTLGFAVMGGHRIGEWFSPRR